MGNDVNAAGSYDLAATHWSLGKEEVVLDTSKTPEQLFEMMMSGGLIGMLSVISASQNKILSSNADIQQSLSRVGYELAHNQTEEANKNIQKIQQAAAQEAAASHQSCMQKAFSWAVDIVAGIMAACAGPAGIIAFAAFMTLEKTGAVKKLAMAIAPNDPALQKAFEVGFAIGAALLVGGVSSMAADGMDSAAAADAAAEGGSSSAGGMAAESSFTKTTVELQQISFVMKENVVANIAELAGANPDVASYIQMGISVALSLSMVCAGLNEASAAEQTEEMEQVVKAPEDVQESLESAHVSGTSVVPEGETEPQALSQEEMQDTAVTQSNDSIKVRVGRQLNKLNKLIKSPGFQKTIGALAQAVQLAAAGGETYTNVNLAEIYKKLKKDEKEIGKLIESIMKQQTATKAVLANQQQRGGISKNVSQEYEAILHAVTQAIEAITQGVVTLSKSRAA